MLSKELKELIPKFIEWIESNRIKSIYPKDVADQFKLNEEDAKQLIRLVEKEVTEFELIRMVDGKRIVKK